MSSTSLPIAGILGLGAPELVVILVIMLVLFGGSKLPSLAKGLGESIREFKKASKDDPAATTVAATPPATPTPAANPATSTPTPAS
jgi:sec-independent protein translocase protein TatA